MEEHLGPMNVSYASASTLPERPSAILNNKLRPNDGIGQLDTDGDADSTDFLLLDLFRDDDDSGEELAGSLFNSFDDAASPTNTKRKTRDEDSVKKPVKKKRRLTKKYDKQELVTSSAPSYANIPLFDDDDFDDDDDDDVGDEKKYAFATTTAPMCRERSMPSHTDTSDTRIASTVRITAIERTMLHGLPLLAGTLQNVTCRCVYASEHSNTNVFQVLDKDTAVSYNFTRQRWAIMARCDNDDSVGDEALSRKTELGEKPPADIGIDTPWFVLVGEMALRSVCSPFFTYTITMTQFDPTAVLFTYNKTAPVYRLFTVTEKKPLFSGGSTSNWCETEVIKSLQDTLYAHVFLRPGRKNLEDVLCAINVFQQADAPHEKPVATKKVSLNQHSERSDRVKKIRELLGKDIKKRFEAVHPVNGNRAEVLAGSMGMRGYSDLLFTDLEKPLLSFRLLGCGMPLQYISSLASWRDANSLTIQTQLNNVYHALIYKQYGGKKYFLAHIAREVHLDPEWFNLYYTWLKVERSDDARFGERDSRLAAYRTFVASDLYHNIIRHIDIYHSHVIFLFTKQRLQTYFDGTLFTRSRLELDEVMFSGGSNGARDRKPTDGDITAEERDSIVTMALAILKQFGIGKFSIVENDSDASKSHSVAVSNEYITVMDAMATFFIRVCNTWRRAVRDKELPTGYATTAPIVSQSTYIYGGDTVEKNRRAVLDVMLANANERVTVSMITAFEDRASMHAKVLSGSHNKHVALVLDNVHDWRLEQLRALGDVANRLGKDSKITHVILLSHANTLSRSVGANVVWDMHTVADTVQRLAFPNDTETRDQGAFWGPVLPRHWVPCGERSNMLFTATQRSEQLAYNNKLICFSQEMDFSDVNNNNPKDMVAVAESLRAIPTTATAGTVVVAYARNKTMNAIHGWIRQSKEALVMAGSTAVVFVSYFKLAEMAAVIRNPKLTILTDISYVGVNRPTCFHCNTLIERTTERVLVLSRRKMFVDMFNANTDEADRTSFHLGRLPYLQRQMETKLHDTKDCKLILNA